MSRTIFARGAALAAATMLALTACGGTDEGETGSDERAAGVQEQEADGAEEGSGEDAEEDGASDAGDAEEGGADAADSEEAGSDGADAEEGAGAAAAGEGAVAEYYLASDNPDGEMIYLEVAVTPGEQFGGVISQQDFYLEDGGEEVDYASTADDEMVAAGYEYFDGPSRRDGEATGYIPIYVEQTGDTLKGAYVRPEAKILGEDETIPEFRGEFEIPAA
jgi:hypothetical protein